MCIIIIGSPRTDEVPSVTNELAEYDDIVATGPARAIQVPPDEEPPASAIINETYEEHPLPTGYAVVDTKDVRENIHIKHEYICTLVVSIVIIYASQVWAEYCTLIPSARNSSRPLTIFSIWPTKSILID